MILNCIQKGGSDKGLKTRNGYLVSFTGSNYSYVSSKKSRTVIVEDDKMYRVKSFCSPTKITSGFGWSA